MGERKPTLQWLPGYRQDELEAAQDKWNIRFPPDLFELFLERRLEVDEPGVIDWVKTPSDQIQKTLRWPFEGLWFDVLNNNLWLDDWGEKPSPPQEQKERLREIVSAAPTLIPIFTHRFIPERPHEVGNPVFSVWRSDIIFYGQNIENYFDVEFGDGKSPDLLSAYKEIEFWSCFTHGDCF